MKTSEEEVLASLSVEERDEINHLLAERELLEAYDGLVDYRAMAALHVNEKELDEMQMEVSALYQALRQGEKLDVSKKGIEQLDMDVSTILWARRELPEREAAFDRALNNLLGERDGSKKTSAETDQRTP